MELPPEESRHISLVLRLKKGDRVTLFDPEGNLFLSEILKADSQRVYVRILKETPKLKRLPVTILAQGLLKADHMDLVVQKGVELGVTDIVPFTSIRSVARYAPGKIDGRLRRWSRIVKEAAKQSGYPGLASIRPPCDLNDVIEILAPDTKGIVLWEEERAKGLKGVLEGLKPDAPVMLLVGPEGGFTPAEVKRAIAAGFASASLGSLTLRSETAAIAALAALQFFRGRLGE